MKLLKKGSRSPSAALLQLALNRAGFGPIDSDGIFGDATESALRKFQSSRSLISDGIAGSKTHRALMPFYTGFLVHRISKGDTVYSIARRYNSSESAVLTANPGLNPQNLRIGGSLTVPLPFEVVPVKIPWFSGLVYLCLRGLRARYPFISVSEIGRSVMGRPLFVLSMGRGENRVLYNAAHHANEWITLPLVLKFAEELAAAYVSGGYIYGQSAAEILDYAAISIVPAVNPDGIDLVTGELQGGEYYERALRISSAYPRFSFPEGWKANISGTDLNLQYPAGWEQAKANKYALGIVSPAPADFVGRAPLSAPESLAMYEFTNRLGPNLTLSFHTQGEVIYWRYLDRLPPGSEEIGRAFSQVSGYALESTPFASGFAGYKDWFIENYDLPGYTIEAGRGVNPLPLGDFDKIYQDNLGILTLAALVT
ncbi:MAG: M14 family metallopeptidase [Candidatus Limivicinus sp.]|jgi:g-D-glutamyl-meso-diaminopimelate peptidase